MPIINGKELEESDFYYSKEGYIIFTESYHLKRGLCCKSGCKHCPWNYSNTFKKKNNTK